MSVSSGGLFGQEVSAAYAASRSAIIGFARSVAVDTRDAGDIQVNMIAPSAYTDMAKGGGKDPRYADLMSPAKVAPVVGWLCSPECTESGLILHAGSGRVRRIQIVGGRPVELVDDNMAACRADLDDMSGAEEAPYASAAGRVLRPEVPWKP
jgi:NAD(P)-dependent dehydrogenase (short-subunit alcohol dehydrogenase family)